MTIVERLRKPEMRAVLRLGIIMIGVCFVECIYVLLASHPLPGAAIIPAAIPLLTAVLVIPEVMKSRGR